jgi:hypothetical protein
VYTTETKTSLKSVVRHRSSDYLSIVTRFYMMQRTKASEIEVAANTRAADYDMEHRMNVGQHGNHDNRFVGDAFISSVCISTCAYHSSDRGFY